ncbi:hypothetical protein [Actinoplanes sp. HUAS TT8]|uniref:hypothetical protein n=1 Tax=Actinoplanes sp. HUAS TT8 TaxID=3447453 RepID=UPI003F51F1E0
MSQRHLTAEQWRVISYLYHPDQLSRRTSPTLATVIASQTVDRDDVVEVVERGLVQARVAGEECTRGPLQRLPETRIRLRLTQAGIYHASHNPQHLILCALRAGLGKLVSLGRLANRLPNRPVSYGELYDQAERGLFTVHLTDGDIEIPIDDVAECLDLVYAQITERGKTFVAYL